jgi:hypothetical protein
LQQIPGDTPVIKSNIRGLTKQKAFTDNEQFVTKKPNLSARKAAGAEGWLSEEARESMNVFMLLIKINQNSSFHTFLTILKLDQNLVAIFSAQKNLKRKKIKAENMSTLMLIFCQHL